MNTDGRGKLGLILDFNTFNKVEVEFESGKDAEIMAHALQEERRFQRMCMSPQYPRLPEIEVFVTSTIGGKYIVWYRDRI